MNQRRRRSRGQAGVTLIEMLVVVVIIGLFVALVLSMLLAITSINDVGM